MSSPHDQIDPTMLGISLRQARMAAGLTQQAVAERLAMARATVAAIEKGLEAVGAVDVTRFADLYGRLVAELVGRRRITEGFAYSFRVEEQRLPTRSGRFAKAIYELQVLAEGYADLEHRLGMPEKWHFPQEYETGRGVLHDEAAAVARSERNRIGLGDGPAGNLRNLLEADSGMRIFCYAMPAELAGLFAFSQELGPCVAINEQHSKEQRQWTLAHEYGHFLMYRHRPDLTVLDPKCMTIRHELLANAFAENFLMPSAGLIRRFSDITRISDSKVSVADIGKLANLYGVSFESMVSRLVSLYKIPPRAWFRLKDQGLIPEEARASQGSQGQLGIEERFPQRYVSLAVQAYKQALLSEGQLSHLLRSDRIETRIAVERHDQSVQGEQDGESLAQ